MVMVNICSIVTDDLRANNRFDREIDAPSDFHFRDLKLPIHGSVRVVKKQQGGLA